MDGSELPVQSDLFQDLEAIANVTNAQLTFGQDENLDVKAEGLEQLQKDYVLLRKNLLKNPNP